MSSAAGAPADMDTFTRAKALFLEGLACFEAARFEDAERCFTVSLKALPERVSTLVNLAATQLRLARPHDALDVANQVLAIELDNLEGWFHRSTALARLGRLDEALTGFDRALVLAPEMGQAWTFRGSVLQELGRLQEAAESFRRAIANGADHELNSYYLATVSAQAAPSSPPRHYVKTLFDDYAAQFDEHLVGVLRYQAHTVLVKHLGSLLHGRFQSALDLGCGTGLCGALIKPMADKLTGVDLSDQMLARAAALGVYDQLVGADIVEYLRGTDQRHDLVLATDVFVYVGDLEPVFSAVRQLIDPAGMFCFSVELADPDSAGLQLQASSRYAHSQPYVLALAARHGFRVVTMVKDVIRQSEDGPINGVFVYLTPECP